jgi:hypothetical protein
MPYRQVLLSTGELTIARISDAAITEWLEVRERNKNLGYPDRPPDIDTPLFRTWIQQPSDPGFEEMKKEAHGANSFPILTLAQEDNTALGRMEPVEAKILISYEENIGYIFRFVVRELKTGYTVMDKESVKPEWDEQYYEDVLNLYSSMFIHPYSNPTMISTYFDFEEIWTETTLAEQELKEYNDSLRFN